MLSGENERVTVGEGGVCMCVEGAYEKERKNNFAVSSTDASDVVWLRTES